MVILGELNVKTREDSTSKFLCCAQHVEPIAYCLCPP